MVVKKPNIVLVVFDTLRWDYFQRFMQNDSLFSEQLKDFVNFDMSFSPSSWTLPSHLSLFTGLYPSEHRVHEDPNSELEEVFQKATGYSGDFLTKIASKKGYRTIGISANPMISGLTGFEEKFDEFYNVDLGKLSGISNTNITNQKFRKIKYLASRVIATIRGYPKNKGYKIILTLLSRFISKDQTFVFMNFMEMHDPYRKIIGTDDNVNILNDFFEIRPLNYKHIKKLRSEYYNQIQKVRESILRIIDVLKNFKKFDDTLVIFTSDHGQALKENGYYGHGTFLYDELIHIPLLIKFPYIYPKEINFKSYVNLVDLHSFLRAVITEENNPYQYLRRDRTYSEAFGLQYSKSSLTKYLSENNRKHIYEKSNVGRKVIIKGGYKLCLNAKSEVEEFYTYSNGVNQNADSNYINDLLFDFKIFNIDKCFIINDNDIKRRIQVTKVDQKI